MGKRKGTKRAVGIHEQLLELLGTVNRPGEFCTAGDRPMLMPGLEVHGLGPLRLPLGTAQARRLIKLGRQAPYGKGTKTVVDTAVRRCWELDPKQFTLTNPQWKTMIGEIVTDVEQALGLTGYKLTPHLYKLLLYEPGGFFLPHRDGEKLDRMVATLVVGLPAVHTGGELIVRHDGHQRTIRYRGAAAGTELSYAAFYADCEHEVRPVQSGYRLCLTYNLTLAAGRGKKGLTAPAYGETIAELGRRLATWCESPDAGKLAVTLEHRYSQKGLSCDMLKGVDRARAQVLFQAAAQAGCVAHLALVTLWQSGEAMGAYGDYFSRRYGRRGDYHWSDDEDEDEDRNEQYSNATPGPYQMGEIYEASLSADHWSDSTGQRVALGEIPLLQSELVSAMPLLDGAPSEEDFEGYTGNAGMTLQRWYRRAAVVVWPRTRHFHVLCAAGTDAAVGGLKSLWSRARRGTKKQREELRAECLAFAAAIIDTWRPRQDAYYHRWEEERPTRDCFPDLLCELDDVALVGRFVAEVLTADPHLSLDKSFVTLCQTHGWSSCAGELEQLMAATTVANANRNVELLRIVCAARDRNEERLTLASHLCAKFVAAFEAEEVKRAQHDWRLPRLDRKALLIASIKAMLAVDAEASLARLLTYALGRTTFDLTDVHLGAAFALEKLLLKRPTTNPAVREWLAACRRELEQRTAEVPREPTDFRRKARLSCSCQDCQALSEFLADPHRKEAHFQMAERRRSHLQSIIAQDRCDCTHTTLRRSNPHILLCTKTTASYEAALKTYERDCANLARLSDLERRLK